VAALIDDALAVPPAAFSELRALSAALPLAEGILPQARGFAAVHPRLTPVIRDGELLVGARVRGAGQTWDWYPDGATDYVRVYAAGAPPVRPDIVAMAERGLISPQGSFNHKVVDFHGFLRTGSAALAARARALMAERTGPARDVAEAFALGHEAMIAHARTYATACRALAETAPRARAAELREMARVCDKVPAHPADTFHEALQMLWFAHMVAGDAVGRVDVCLHDFYARDLAAGRITPASAQELIECFLAKLHTDVFEGELNVSSVLTLTLGGVLADGRDATNDLTRLFLRAIRAVRLLRPTVYLRCHDGMPPDVLELAIELLAEGLAEPSFYWDAPILAGLQRIGVPLAEARNYALSGCTEVVSPGLGNWGAPNGWINLALLVDEALRGCTGNTPDAVWAAIDAHITTVADACRDATTYLDARDTDPRLGTTLLMPVCLERGADVMHGGAASYYGHWEAMGLSNAAEMLHAALTLLGEGEALPDLFARLDAGDPALRARIEGLPRFGNDVPAVDALAAALTTRLADALEARATPLRRALVLGHLAGGENMHLAYGQRMGATLDGRRAGQTLADSLAGGQGCTRQGPTAAIRSLCRLDHSRLIAGNVSTLRLTERDMATPEGRARVAALVRTFGALGGSQLQLNVVDAATLRAAQADPAAHRGLMVRVAGYSSEFTRLGAALQDEIIARAE
jgi:formate C-acetyltransferase